MNVGDMTINNQTGQNKEDYGRMRDLITNSFDAVEHFLQKCLWRRGLDDGDNTSLLTHGAEPFQCWFAAVTAPIRNN
jgi:hypothetical protein